MRILEAYFYFYQKVFLISFLVSVLFCFIAGFSFENLALSYLLFSPFFHYMIYEIRNKNEYDFYGNFGLSRKFLWMMTLLISLILEILVWKF